MKIIIISILLMSNTMAKSKDKTLELKAHVHSALLERGGAYRLELKEYAAAYTAEENFLPCLQRSIKENKLVTLKVHAFSLKVLDCKID